MKKHSSVLVEFSQNIFLFYLRENKNESNF